MARLALFGLLALLVRCGPDQPVLEVSVTGLSDDIRALQATASLNNIPLSGPSIVTQRLDSFLIDLPTGYAGPLHLSVGGLEEDGCLVAQGQADTTITGAGRYQLSVELIALKDKACQVVLTKTEKGIGTVTSDPPGLVCDGKCQSVRFAFAPGTTVKLTAQAENTSSYFAGWLGACAGIGTCTVKVSNEPVQVIARFLPRKICSDDNWCWENPLPQGITVGAVWASSDHDVWAVGLGGTIMHWDGSLWTPFSSATTSDLYAMWGIGPSDVWAVGGGSIVHWDGTAWSVTHTGSGKDFYTSIWGTGSADIWVGTDYLNYVLHWDGSSWSQVQVPSTGCSLNVRGSGPTDVWAVGYADGGPTCHWNGVTWSEIPLGTDGVSLDAVWASGPADAWAVGANPHSTEALIFHWDGRAWSVSRKVEAAMFPKGFTGVWGIATGFTSVWGSGPRDVWAVGEGGLILHWDGSSWLAASSGTTDVLSTVWGSGPQDVWAATWGGTVLHWNGTFWGVSLLESGPAQELHDVWGSSAEDVWAVGDGIVHWNGAAWVRDPSGDVVPDVYLSSVWGSGSNDFWAAGGGLRDPNGIILHWDGNSWSFAYSLPNSPLGRIRGSGPQDVWATGRYNNAILHWDGNAWNAIDSGLGPGGQLVGLWVDRSAGVWITSLNALLRWNGTTFSSVNFPPELTFGNGVSTGGLWASGPNNVWVTIGNGTDGRVLRWNGAVFTADSPRLPLALQVWGTSSNDVWILGGGSTGTQHWNGSSVVDSNTGNADLFALWGIGDHVWVVGDGGAILHHTPRMPP